MKPLNLIVLLFTLLCGFVFANGTRNFVLEFTQMDQDVLDILDRDRCTVLCHRFEKRTESVFLHPETKWCDCRDESNQTLIFAPPDWISPNSRARSEGLLSNCTEKKVLRLERCAPTLLTQ